MTDSLEVPYATFVASRRAGGFHPPPPGAWSAELVAAHVACKNDLIADAAEASARGEESSVAACSGIGRSTVRAHGPGRRLWIRALRHQPA